MYFWCITDKRDQRYERLSKTWQTILCDGELQFLRGSSEAKFFAHLLPIPSVSPAALPRCLTILKSCVFHPLFLLCLMILEHR
jgi:hypothetical protein